MKYSSRQVVKIAKIYTAFRKAETEFGDAIFCSGINKMRRDNLYDYYKTRNAAYELLKTISEYRERVPQEIRELLINSKALSELEKKCNDFLSVSSKI